MKPLQKSKPTLKGKYSADSDTPMSRRVLEPVDNGRKAQKYNNYVRREKKEPKQYNNRPFNPYLFIIDWGWNIFYISIPIMFFMYH